MLTVCVVFTEPFSIGKSGCTGFESAWTEEWHDLKVTVRACQDEIGVCGSDLACAHIVGVFGEGGDGGL